MAPGRGTHPQRGARDGHQPPHRDAALTNPWTRSGDPGCLRHQLFAPDEPSILTAIGNVLEEATQDG